MRDFSREIFIVGPTAIGKSTVAFQLAKRLEAEIISADSMQVYQNVPIATDQPDRVYQNQIPHHMVHRIHPTQNYTVYEYMKEVHFILDRLHQRHQYAVIVGGSGLYIRSLIDGIFEYEPNSSIESKTSEMTYERLQQVDAISASKIHPNNHRRIERALSFYDQTGKPISQFKKQWNLSQKIPYYFGLDMDRENLKKYINVRVDQMMDLGLEKEALTIYHIRHQAKTLSQAIGIKEFFKYFDGDQSLRQTVDLIKIHSHQLAKKQRTWFYKDPRIHWIQIKNNLDPMEIVEKIKQNI